jgi:hypothetical protein
MRSNDLKTSTDLPRMRRPEIGAEVQVVRTVRELTLLLVLIGCVGCARDGSATSSKALRVGHTYVNGNCALDSDHKLTGLCEGSGRNGCISHTPDPDSPRCQAGLVATETRSPACSTATSQEVVSRDHQCFFVER